ncbi:MAG: hypothetical protein M0R34_00470 [Candidatus Marinimicrobia bacterium]|jgi:hypothetical protein|nr:hypothetical protein [Candidatus Neomarinimicrobiota bacterium]
MSVETIQQLIDKSLIRQPRERSGKWSPSSFGRCYRAQYWNRKDEPQSNPPDKRTLRVFNAGNLFEDFVVSLLPKDYQLQVLVESDDVKGYADIVTSNEVIDIKSQHSKSFWYMSKFKKDDIKKEKYPNWLQVMYYTRELKKDFGRLVFVSKDDLCIMEFVQPLDDYWLAQLDMELSELRRLWEQDELPKAEPRCFINKDGKSKECQYCSFKILCEETEKRIK